MAGALPVAATGGSAREVDVDLRCFGAFSLRVGGVEVGWRGLRPRARALLMLLALHHGRPVHREELIEALWPDATLAAGIRSLQVAVSAVRACLTSSGLADAAVRRHGDAYALDLPGVRDERACFEALAGRAGQDRAAGRLDAAWRTRVAALELYAGDLLPEVGPAEWVLVERDRLRLLAARLGADAAQEAMSLNELAAGLRAVRRSVELDPYSDASWALLVELCERLGDHSAATVARREHARIRADLGVGPTALVTRGR